MIRRVFAVTVALCLSGWAVRATERATFILTDGERISGGLAFHTNTRETLIDNDFSLTITPGQPELRFRYDQVAVIDFIGGTPATAELAALPSKGHLLAMRNGATRLGHFVNLIGGDTIKWQDEGGPTRDVSIREAGRIYLNPDSARNTFNYRPDASRGAVQAPPPNDSRRGGRGFRMVGNDVIVQGATPWTDSGLDVMRGDRLRFDASGDITFIHGPNSTTGPGGKADVKSSKFPLSSQPLGALIGRIGLRGAPFAIGGDRGIVTMTSTGRLMFGVNDDVFGDNSGAFQVTIMRGR